MIQFIANLRLILQNVYSQTKWNVNDWNIHKEVLTFWTYCHEEYQRVVKMNF